MATDEEILQLRASFPAKTKPDEAVIRLYRAAGNAGQQAALSAMEKELLSDATIESALKTFGWGRRNRTSLITMRALMREAFRLAAEKAGKK